MSGKLMGEVYERELARPLREVLLAMADHADEDGCNVFPSTWLLAWKLGLDRRPVQRRIKKLRQLGVLVLVEKARQHRANEYRIDLEALPRKPEFEPLRGVHSATPNDDGADPGASTGSIQGRPDGHSGASTRSPGASTAPPEPSVESPVESPEESGKSKGIERPTSDFDKEDFFAKKKAKAREECEEEARKGSIWHARILDGMDELDEEPGR